LFAVPAIVFAATPQQILTRALTLSKKANVLHADMTIRAETRQLYTKAKPDIKQFALLLTARTPTAQSKDNEGRLVAGMTLKNPELTVQWKYQDKILYARAEQAGPEVMDLLKTMDMESLLVGQWIRFDSATSVFDDLSSSSLVSGTTSLSPDLLSSLQTTNAKRPPLMIATSINKRAKTADGKTIWKVNARLNPAYLTFEQQRMLKTVRRDRDYAINVRAINKSFTETRKIWILPRFVALIDPASGAMQRLEYGLRYSALQDTCTWNNRTFRSVCKKDKRLTLTLNGGLSYLNDSGSPIVAPSSSVTLEEFLNQVKDASEATSTEETTTP